MPAASFVFLGSLLVGLLLGVYAMLTGVERPRRARPGRTGLGGGGGGGGGGDAPRTALSAPLIAAFLTAFGVLGYLLARYTALHPAVSVTIAALVGAAGLAGAVALVTRWAVPSAAADHEDPRYLLQGTPARVVRPILADGAGEVVYDAHGTEVAALAVSFDGAPIEAGTEVVIDRVENGVAHVEAWAAVEKRL